MARCHHTGLPARLAMRFVHRPSHELAVVDPDGEDDNNLTGKVDVARASGPQQPDWEHLAVQLGL